MVRYLGGDESLVDAIRRNREIAVNEPDSTQAFMAANVTEQPQAVVIDEHNGAMDLEERRARLVRYQAETRAVEVQNREIELKTREHELNFIEKFRTYTVQHVRDSRINEMLQNDITNRKYTVFETFYFCTKKMTLPHI